MTELVGRHIAITGALGGIGSIVVKHLSALGAQLLCIDVETEEFGQSRLSEIGLPSGSFAYLTIDIAKDEDLDRLGEQLNKGAHHDLVSLAAVVISGDLKDQKSADIRRMIDVNLTSQMLLSQVFLRTWHSTGYPGQMVFVSSWVDSFPWPGITPYASSKAGLVAMARGIARENATQGIRANVISPGIVDVGMAAKQWREESDYRARASRAIPLGRLQDPIEVAYGIEFLLSEKSRYMTGSTLLIDGGASLYPMDPKEVGQ